MHLDELTVINLGQECLHTMHLLCRLEKFVFIEEREKKKGTKMEVNWHHSELAQEKENCHITSGTLTFGWKILFTSEILNAWHGVLFKVLHRSSVTVLSCANTHSCGIHGTSGGPRSR